MPGDLGRIIESSLGALGLRRRLKEMSAVLAWPSIVGAELARRTHARYVQGGILFVNTASSAWSHQLSLMRPALIERLNAALGERIVNDIRFSVGAQDENPHAGKRPASRARSRQQPPIGPEAAEAAASAPEEFRELLSRLAAAQSELAATRSDAATGRCRECGQPTGQNGDLCPVCRGNQESTRRLQVRAALAQNPALSWNQAAEAISGLSPLDYRAEHDDLQVQLWGTFTRSRDAADPEITRQAAMTYLMCKLSRPAAALPPEEIAALTHVPLSIKSE